MINFTQHAGNRIHAIFTEEGKKAHPNVVSVLELLSHFNTYDVMVPELSKRGAYWQFLHACLDNMVTNTWMTLPRMWIEYCCAAVDFVLTEQQIKAEYDLYLAHRERVLRKLGLPTHRDRDKEVILNWVRNKRSEQYLIGIAHALLRIYLFYSEKDVAGINNNVASEPRHNDASFDAGDQPIWSISFDDADQAVWPLEGRNKFEVLKNNFKEPLDQHEKMI